MKFRQVQANNGMQPKRAKGQHWTTRMAFFDSQRLGTRYTVYCLCIESRLISMDGATQISIRNLK